MCSLVLVLDFFRHRREQSTKDFSNGAEYHNHTMKIVDCNLHVWIDKTTTFKWNSFDYVRIGTNKCHDAT